MWRSGLETAHLTTTDPAAHLKFVMGESSGIIMSNIDEHAELEGISKKF